MAIHLTFSVYFCISQIYLDDMIRFMDKEAALKAMHLMGITCEDEGISKSSLKIWLVVNL